MLAHSAANKCFVVFLGSTPSSLSSQKYFHTELSLVRVNLAPKSEHHRILLSYLMNFCAQAPLLHLYLLNKKGFLVMMQPSLLFHCQNSSQRPERVGELYSITRKVEVVLDSIIRSPISLAFRGFRGDIPAHFIFSAFQHPTTTFQGKRFSRTEFFPTIVQNFAYSKILYYFLSDSLI